MTISSEAAASVSRAVLHGLRRDLGGVGLRIWALATFAFLYLPIVIVVITTFSSEETLTFPPEGLSLRWYVTFWDILTGNPPPGVPGRFWEALIGTVTVAAFVTVIGLFAGTLAAFALHRWVFRGRELIRTMFLLPLLFPSLVVAIGLLLFFNKAGLTATTPRMVIGHVVSTLPFVTILVLASLSVYQRELEDAALSLGANRMQTFWRITLPLIRPGLLAAGILAFNSSFGNVIMTFFLTTGTPHLLPVWILYYIQGASDPGVAVIMVIQIILLLPTLYFVNRLVGLQRLTGGHDAGA